MIRIVVQGIFFLLFNSFSIASGQSVVQGNTPDYKGQTLIFYTYTNQISNTEKPIATVKVHDDGNFSFEIELTYTDYIFCHKGIFFMYLYVEPGMHYTVKLPKFIQRKPEDKINPFFQEVKVHLVLNSFKALVNPLHVDSTKELNFLIRTFDDYFDPFYNKFARQMYIKQAVGDLDSTLQKIESTFANNGNPYFETYYQYRMGLLKFMSSRFKSRHISDNYFLSKPMLYDHPAYMELFNKVYDKYFVYFGRTQVGKVIYEDINAAKSLSRLKSTLAQDKVLSNDTLKEMVILKGIHDGFYEMEFQRQALLQILDSLVKTSKIKEIRNIGGEIRYKITRLLAGYEPPPFSLLNQDSIWTTLDKFKGSFVYLIFGTTQNYACLKEFQMLKKIQDKHPDLIKVVVVSADEKFSDIRMFARKSQLKWTFLYYDNNAQPDILKQYDIRTVPTCFLIDKAGKLAISPAPLPSENFEGYLFNYLKANKIL